MADSADIVILRNMIYKLLLERGQLMATIEEVTASMKQLEGDIATLVEAHSVCPTAAQLKAVVDSVQGMSTVVRSAIAKDAQA